MSALPPSFSHVVATMVVLTGEAVKADPSSGLDKTVLPDPDEAGGITSERLATVRLSVDKPIASMC